MVVVVFGPSLNLVAPCGLRVESRSRTRLRVRGLYRVFVSHLFLKGFEHYSTTIARLSPSSGLE